MQRLTPTLAGEALPEDRPRRREALIENMSSRLRPLCADWPDDAFHEMVKRLADITLKYEGRATTAIYDRRATDSLRGDVRTMLDATDEAKEEEKP